MPTLEFLAEFKALHDKAKKGTLTPAERTRYEDGRRQLSRVVVMAQQLGHAGQTLRASLRMAKMLKVELRPERGEPMKLATVDLGTGGFAVLTASGMPLGTVLGFTLHLPSPSGGGTTPITGKCRVASSRAASGAPRVSFRFEELAPAAQEQLEITLIDAVLERLRTA